MTTPLLAAAHALVRPWRVVRTDDGQVLHTVDPAALWPLVDACALARGIVTRRGERVEQWR